MLDRCLRRYIRHGTLTQLAAFEAVVQLGSFTRAADALHMAQPTVSLLVKKLGETLGTPLFESTSRKIQLTAAGTETFSFCQQLFQSFTGFNNRLIELQLNARFALRIAICTGAESIIPAMLCSFCEQHPEMKLILSVANRAHLLDRLAMGTDDFYIFGVPPEDADVRMHPLCTDEFNIYASAAHSHTYKRRLSMNEIARQPLLMREEGSRAREIADALFAEHDCQPNIRMEMDNNDAIQCAVAAGFGIALLSQHAVDSSSHHEALVLVRVEGLPVRHQWQLVYRVDKNLSEPELELVDELRQRSDYVGQRLHGARPSVEHLTMTES